MRFFWLLLVALGLGTKRHWHILFAIVLGIVLGLLFADPVYAPLHQIFEVVGQVFIRLIQMIVIPLVVSSLVVGVSSLGDGRQLGRMGARVVSLFLVLMTLAAMIAGGLALFLQPGRHLAPLLVHAPAQTLARLAPGGQPSAPPTAPSEAPTVGVGLPAETPQPPAPPPFVSRAEADLPSVAHRPPPSLRELFFNMIPQNPIASLARAELVPVILFALVFGAAVAFVGEAGKPLVSLFESLFTVTMKLTDWVMILSVPGIFSLTFTSVATAGLDVFVRLAPYTLVILMALLVQAFVILPLMLRFLARVDFMNLYRAISEALMVAFGTASSSATLPITMACCERRAGISNRIASFVLPTGVTINKTGTTVFEVVAVLLLAQAYGVRLGPFELVLTLIFAIIASIGTAGVPSGGLLTIAVVFNSLGYDPLMFTAGLALLWSIDRVLDMCRTVVNVMSTCSVATVIAANEGELNREVLNNRDVWMDVV